MTQAEINRLVAGATGESVRTVSELGFGLADPDVVDFDPEPADIEDLIVDWDALDLRRNTASLFPSLGLTQPVALHA
jgi:hypothetical protein